MAWAHDVSIVFFSLLAAVHALRLILGWPAQLGSWDVPMWVSALAVLLTGTLAFFLYKER